MEWIEDFLKLYMSEETSNFRKALEIKCNHIPKKLYRYRPLKGKNSIQRRTSEIVNGELYMSHPQDLNDPFEMCSNLSSNNPLDYLANKKAKYAKAFLDAIPRDKHREIFSSSDWYDSMTSYLSMKYSKSSNFEEDKKLYKKITLSRFEELNADFNDTSRKLVRVACFSTSPTNVPMWSHYTDHEGICLEYNTDEIDNVYQKNMLFPVKYVDELPDAVLMMLSNDFPPWGIYEYIPMHKFKDWSYENEWRLIFNVGSWYYSSDDVPNSFYSNGKTIQFIRPSRIIMGVNISKYNRKRIEKIAYDANVPLVQAKKTEYGLKIEEVE